MNSIFHDFESYDNVTTGVVDRARAVTTLGATSSTTSHCGQSKATSVIGEFGTKIGAKNGEHSMREIESGREN